MNKLTISLMAVLAVLAIGCGEKKKSSGPAPIPVPTPTPPPGGNQNVTASGAAVYLDANKTVLSDYSGQTITNPTNIVLTVDLYDVDPSDVDLFGGQMEISFDDETQWGTVHHSGIFNAGMDEYNSQFNRWVDAEGYHHFKAFAEDAYGAIIIVADEMADDLGLYNGKIFYRNWDYSACGSGPPWYCNVKPPTMCWFISRGPYQCQAFLDNGEIDLESRMYPETYTLLGTFEGLDMNAALNLD
jgi:hypothetical protein